MICPKQTKTLTGSLAAILLLFIVHPAYSQDVSLSQAGCACLPTWYDAAGIERAGCANPDNDPMGAWCQVNPKSCLGYYGMYTSANGSDVFYDYCSAVRETTDSGCLCAPDWSMGPTAKVGKPHYRDRCARPEAQDGKRKCRVDLATCPNKSSPLEFDTCEDLVEPLTIAKYTTYNQCACKLSWGYTYANGSVANFTGCANPDGDPMGPWCAVDPETCDRFAGEMITADNMTVGYDYCTKKFRHPEPNSCAAVLKQFDQCGGKSMCSDFGCQDAVWPGACCPSGTKCYRQDAFYYQCLTPYDVQKLKDQQVSDSEFPIGSMSESLDENLGENVPSELPAESPDSSSLASPETQANLHQTLDVQAETLPDSTGVPQTPAVKIYTKLKIDMDYDELMDAPLQVSQFKTDVASWMTAATGSPEYVQHAGVEAIVRGSVVALAFVTFRPNTPTEAIALANSRLRSMTDSMYRESVLAQAWGPLVSYLVAPDAASLSTGELLGMEEPGNRSKKLAPGAAAGIAVGVLLAVAISGYVVIRTLSRKDTLDSAAPGMPDSKLQQGQPEPGFSQVKTHLSQQQQNFTAIIIQQQSKLRAFVQQEQQKLQEWLDKHKAKRATQNEGPAGHLSLPVAMASNPLASTDDELHALGLGTRTAPVPDAASLPKAEGDGNAEEEEDIDLSTNPVGLLRTIYGPNSRSSSTNTYGFTTPCGSFPTTPKGGINPSPLSTTAFTDVASAGDAAAAGNTGSAKLSTVAADATSMAVPNAKCPASSTTSSTDAEGLDNAADKSSTAAGKLSYAAAALRHSSSSAEQGAN